MAALISQLARIPVRLSVAVQCCRRHLAETAAALPDLAARWRLVAAALTTSTEPAVRLQQLCGAATAKSMEDCLFYRDARLVSLNEVGGEPDGSA